jgi:hypothetical protein
LLRAALWSSLLAALVLASSLHVVPWLGRRGDLNPIVEGMLASAFKVPVRIGNVVSEPLSDLTVTRLESVRARAEGRLHFSARSISVHYDPIELLAGKLRHMILVRPEVFLDLDAPLDDVTRLPDPPPRARETPDGRVLPVTAGSFIVDGGDLTLRLQGRDLPLSDLRVQIWRLGEERGQEVTLSVNALGGRVRASGILDIEREPGKSTRYAIRSMEASAKGISAPALAAWALGWSPSPGGPEPAGTIDVQCSLAGTWPEKVDVLLTTRASGLAAGAGTDAAVERAALGLRIDASVFGDLERIVFAAVSRGEASLTVEAREITQGAAADFSGEYRRLGEEGGVIDLRPSRILLESLGEIRIEGTVPAVRGEAPAESGLAVEVRSLDLREAAARVPHQLLSPRLRDALLEAGVEGRIEGMLRVGGTLERPEATGAFELREIVLPLLGTDLPPLAARSAFAGVRIDSTSGEVDFERLLLEVDGVPTEAVTRVLGASRWRASGDLSASVDVTGACLPLERSMPRARVDIAWTSGALDREAGFAGATGIAARSTLDLELHPLEHTLEIELDSNVRLEEILLGSFYARPAGRQSTLGARGALRWSEEGGIEAVSIDRLTADTPLTGPVVARGSISGGADGLRIAGAAGLAAIPLAEAFPAFVRNPLAPSVPILAGSSLEGVGSLSARVEGAIASPRVSGRLTLRRTRADLGGIAIEGLEADVPFEAGAPPGEASFASRGAIRAGRVAAGPAETRGLDLPFRFERGAYSLASPRRIEVLGGTVDIAGASLSPAGRPVPSASVTLRAAGLDMLELTRGLELPEVAGTLGLDLRPLRLTARGRLEARGVISLLAFGGTISFVDLIIENLGKPYSDLRLGRGHIESVRLLDVGNTFRFGLLSGVLRGVIVGLEITGGDVVSFEADVETVRVPGVPQYVNKKAIESIRRILGGPLGAIEESLFSRFHYDRFGFWCRLRDGVFRLRGKYLKGGVEYVMFTRWYRFPRIDIVNGRPDLPYDWRSILANLRAVYAGGAGEEGGE